MVAARNPVMLYDVESFSDELDIACFRRHESVKELIIEEDAFVLHAVHIDPSVDRMVWDMAVKMQETLEYSREATFQRSPFRISQREVRLVYLD